MKRNEQMKEEKKERCNEGRKREGKEANKSRNYKKDRMKRNE